MKKIKNDIELESDDMLDNYDFDYSKAKPNRFAALLLEQEGYVKLDPEVLKVFKTSEQVNLALTALINAIPQKANRRLHK